MISLTMRFIKIIFFIYVFLISTNLLSQSNTYNTSIPNKGEGLNAFLIRNNLNPTEHKAEFIELNKKNLGKKNSLRKDVAYNLPNTEKWIEEPLFGKDRSKFKLDSNILKGTVFHLVSGHGGPDPGALGKYGDKTLAEDEYAYDITLRLAKRLMENGAKVNMIIQDENDGIRDESFLKMSDDETCMGATIPLDQMKRLKQRTEAVNKLYAQNKPAYQRCVVIHVDSRSTGKSIDVFFYHAPKSKSGKKAAEEIRSVFNTKYNKHQPSRGYSGVVKDRNLYVLRKTIPTAVFVELGNIRNFSDQQRFILQDNRQALANWMYEGLLNDFKKHK
ncbi:N-acetylmuramoyl-L-alanine amidase family protein [Saccharicrinis aurantiacus]|uniref:N-acetylmuramoyl-L-alanine amidase family protein n=1 Tax=Saccharicrinis aurantiacus TaxID=1849719 RepID=UPI00249266A5|nr:N-acetylmuramoyl-L-alanine amidase [Saccharicrinis aurantiacus]